jgi:hypothetical protein
VKITSSLAVKLTNSGTVKVFAAGAVFSSLYVQSSSQVKVTLASSDSTFVVYQTPHTKLGAVVSFVITKVVEPSSSAPFFTQATTLLAHSTKLAEFTLKSIWAQEV